MIWNDALDLKVTNAMLHHNVDNTRYQGLTLKAWPAGTGVDPTLDAPPLSLNEESALT